MTNATDALRDALYNLHELTQCRCHDDYKSRGRIDPDCNHDYREDVDALQAEVARAREMNRALADDLCAAEAEAARLRTVDEAMVGRALRSYWGTKGKTFTKDKCHAMRRALIAAMGSANGQADAADTTAGEG